MCNDKTLKGKNAIITGASRGIGRAIAVKFAKLGANIVLNYKSNDKSVSKVISEIKKIGVDVIAIKSDISSFDESKNVIKSAN